MAQSSDNGNARARAAAAEASLESARHKLEEAGGQVREAAHLAGEAVRERVAESTKHAREVADEQLDVALGKGRELLEAAEEWIRERPLPAFGIAFAAGWLIAKLTRRLG